jgi:hypothetical protein
MWVTILMVSYCLHLGSIEQVFPMTPMLQASPGSSTMSLVNAQGVPTLLSQRSLAQPLFSPLILAAT